MQKYVGRYMQKYVVTDALVSVYRLNIAPSDVAEAASHASSASTADSGVKPPAFRDRAARDSEMISPTIPR
jgi:hypothetical protein